jgi:SnoaL-like domain
MTKSAIALVCGMAGLIAGTLLSDHLLSAAATSYGEDRAQIEDLQARYLFALDFHDPQLYASTFAPDGILDYGEGDVKGREAIIKVIANMPGNRPAPPPEDGKPALRPAAGRHQITNIVLKINGNKAIGRSAWFHIGNDNTTRSNTIGGFGHYEDELVKINGQWFFTKRKIYNEGSARWQYKDVKNPAW